MPKPGLERTVRLSLLDRLTDEHPELSTDPAMGFQESRDRLLISLRRDLEWLLNTHRGAEADPEAFEELRRSVYHYGVPDISSVSHGSADAQARLLRQVKEAIVAFEPRLTNVRVSEAPAPPGEVRREVRFIIHGLLRVDPNPEQVVFDTVLELASGEYEVKGSRNA
jgi:type VI secretion system protein ImpF